VSVEELARAPARAGSTCTATATSLVLLLAMAQSKGSSPNLNNIRDILDHAVVVATFNL
jgi:hypothetical protein